VQPALQDEPRRSRGVWGPSLAENRPKTGKSEYRVDNEPLRSVFASFSESRIMFTTGWEPPNLLIDDVRQDRCLRNKRPSQPNGFIGLGAMDVTKPYEFIEFGAMDVTCIGLELHSGHSRKLRPKRVTHLHGKTQFPEDEGDPGRHSVVQCARGLGDDLGQKEVEGRRQREHLSKMTEQRVDHCTVETESWGPAKPKPGKDEGTMAKFRKGRGPAGLKAPIRANRDADVFGGLRDNHSLPKGEVV
jgi:hypothetical protein